MRGDFLLPALVFWPMAGAVIAYILGRRGEKPRCAATAAVAIAELAAFAAVFRVSAGFPEMRFAWEDFCGLGINFRLDGFRLIFGAITAFIWAMTSLSGIDYFRGARSLNRYCFFNLFTFGATIGIFLAADLFTAFIFFEIMGLASYILVIHEETPFAMRAGETYLAVTVIGGMVMLMGLFLLYSLVGMPDIGELAAACADVTDKKRLYLAGALILAGYGVKAGMFPLHIWLPDTYMAAPAPVTTILSGILSKTGVFGILALCANVFQGDREWGLAMLALSAATMLAASVLAVLSADLKRTLAYSSMSQIGFILMGCAMQCVSGEHNALAVRGTLLHMVNHSLIKLVLFTAAGVIFLNLKTLNLNAVRGFGRGKPLLALCFLMGALSISGVPLWNGYVSKTLIHESIIEHIQTFSEYSAEARLFQAAEAAFIFCGGLTAAYMAKLFTALFLEKPRRPEETVRGRQYMGGLTAFALAFAAAILPLLGMFPGKLMDGLAVIGQGFLNGENPAHAVHYFSLINLRGSLPSLLIGAVVYLLVVRTCLMKTDESGGRVYIEGWPARLDIERLFYRPLVRAMIWIGAFLSRLADRGTNVGVIIWAGAFISRLADSATNTNILVWLGAFISRLADLIPRLAHRLAGRVLRPARARRHPGPTEPHIKRRTTIAASRILSFVLLFLGIALCAALLYLVAAARG